MKKIKRIRFILICSALSIFVLYLIGPWTSAWLIEKSVEKDCSLSSPDTTCIARMRALGHYWSSLGFLPQAKEWYEVAANNGDEIAMFHLGWVYEEWAEKEKLKAKNNNGIEAQQSYSAIMKYAMGWYQKSAEKGFAPAMNNLGQMYLLGGDDEKMKNSAEAFKWNMEAAQAGNPLGRWNVMLAYTAGLGVQRNPVEAQKWAYWDPGTANPKDLNSPTLERTRLFNMPLPSNEIVMIKLAIKENVPMTLSYSPLKPDPSLITFEQMRAKLPH